MKAKFWLALIGLLICISPAEAQTTAFTYQGKLTNNTGQALTGNYDFQFRLFDAQSGGNQVGATLTLDGAGANPPFVVVTGGIFTVTLDFASCSPQATCFNGAARFLDISVKEHGGGSYTPLTPRQPVTASPYAIKTQYVSVNGAYDDGSVPSPIYAASNTFVGESAGANTIFNTNLTSVLGKLNSFFGGGAGKSNFTGFNNSYFGTGAGFKNIEGSDNAFFGGSAGYANTEGVSNAFFGAYAGYSNTTACCNAFFGGSAGASNTTGSGNAFFGGAAGYANTTGSGNVFFGEEAGNLNTTGAQNTFFGTVAGLSNTTGGSNTLIGYFADVGAGNLTNAAAIGAFARVTQNNSLVLGSINGTNGATADTNVGIGTTAPSQRLHVVGNGVFTGNLTVNGTLNAGDFNISGNLVANVVTSGTQFNIGGSRVLSVNGSGSTFVGVSAGTSTSGPLNSFFGNLAGNATTSGSGNSFFGNSAGLSNTGDANSFFGVEAGRNNTTGARNTFIGSQSGLSNSTENRNTFIGVNANGTAGITEATAIGSRAQVTQSNSLVLGSINGINTASADTNVGIGTTAPQSRLHIAVNGGNLLLGHAGCGPGHTGIGFGASLSGCNNYALLGNSTDTLINRPAGGGIFFRENNVDQVVIEAGGAVRITTLGSSGGTQLCRNLSNQISNCSSSRRYKSNIATLHTGLTLINRLRPVTFDWQQNGEPDLGLVAEEVAKVEPLLVTRNDKGEIEGVKYDRVSVVLLNAVKEQQQLIERQQQQIEALKKLVCSSHRKARVCK